MSDFRKNTSLQGSRSFKVAHPQKVFGYDNLASSTMKKSGIDIGPDLQSTMNEEQNLEEQYIKGLQDEVKLLEYELKLLKDKEGDDATNMTGFLTFFNDGLQINEDILAIKNIYKLTVQNLDDAITHYLNRNGKLQNNVQMLRMDIEDLHQKYKDVQDTISKRYNILKAEYADLMEQNKDQMYQLEDNNIKIKDLRAKVDKTSRDIMTIDKTREKAQIKGEKDKKLRENELKRIQQDIIELDQIICDLTKEFESIDEPHQFELIKSNLGEDNENLDQKILSTKNEINNFSNKQNEINAALQYLERQREKDFKLRRQMNAKINDVQTKIERENQLSDKMIMMQVEEKIKEETRKLDMEIKNLQTKQIDLNVKRLYDYEQGSSNLVNTQSDRNEVILTNTDNKALLDKDFKETYEAYHQLRISRDMSKLRQEELSLLLRDIQKNIEVMTQKLPKLKSQISFSSYHVENYFKHLQLINQVKNFNFEEILMIAVSNDQLNTSINSLINAVNMIKLSTEELNRQRNDK